MFRTSLILTFLFVGILAQAQTLWDGPTIAFEKANSADWTLEINQDRITENVWLTRQDGQLLFNIKSETLADSVSPSGTSWAYGKLNEIASLSFQPFKLAASPVKNIVGKDIVMHLELEDAYVQFNFTKWSSGSGAGGFAYTRSTKSSAGSNKIPTNAIGYVATNVYEYLELVNVTSERINVATIVCNDGKVTHFENHIQNNKLDARSLAQGMYVLILQTENSIYKYKFFKN
jgi:hypothetical protein